MRAAVVVLAELLALVPGIVLFVVGPAIGLALAFAPTTPRLFGVPLGLGLAAVTLWSLAELVAMIRERFGLRLVAQLERPHAAVASTALSGSTIAAALRRLDALAAARSLPSLRAFGLTARAPFIEAAQLLPTLDALIDGTQGPLRAELARLAGALRDAQAAQVRVRLRLIAGTAMNAALYADLRARGF